jgi:hypothetical protein
MRNADVVLETFTTMRKSAPGETSKGVRALADSILRDVKDSRAGTGVPRDTGDLANSGVATGPDAAGVSRVTFGGPAAPYALFVHEIAANYALGETRYLVRGVDRAQSEGEPLNVLRGLALEVVRRGAR